MKDITIYDEYWDESEYDTKSAPLMELMDKLNGYLDVGDYRHAYGVIKRMVAEYPDSPTVQQLYGDLMDIYKYETRGSKLIKYRGTAELIIIKNGIREIGDYAFSANEYIRTVILPPAVAKIGKCAFSYCTNLTDIKFGSQSPIVIGSEAFYRTGIPKNNFPKWVKDSAIHSSQNIYSLDETYTNSNYTNGYYIPTHEQDKRKKENRCIYCGGPFKGIFVKKCVLCKRLKDY